MAQATKADGGNLKFWETQSELVLLLNELGIPCKIVDRLEPFKLAQKLLKLDTEMARRAHGYLAMLVQLKRLGYEPSHKNKKYV